MVTQQSDQNADIRRTFSRRAAPDLKIIGQSNIFYWWPAWVAGFAVALLSYLQGRDVTFMPEIVERVHPSNNPGIFFIAVLVLLIIFTTTKLRGIYSVVTVITVAFFVVLFAWPRTQPRPHPSASRKFFAVSAIGICWYVGRS